MAVAVSKPCSCGGKVLLTTIVNDHKVEGKCKSCGKKHIYSVGGIPTQVLRKLHGFKEYMQKVQEKTLRIPRILFADDEALDPIYCWEGLLIDPLKKAGVLVEIETDPDKVVDWVPRVDAILLDMTWYGKVRGPEIFKKIKEIGTVPVIIMSSVWPEPGVGDDFVNKGFGLTGRVFESLTRLKVI